jgi:phosphoribosylformylglycinamidine (FGAM) synthase-like enzyme
VAEAARNVVCSGALPLAVTDNLNFGSPEKPEIFWQFEQAAEGISEACRMLDTPVIGGNVSLYNETNGTAIYPTPTIGMVGLIEDVDHIMTQSFKSQGDILLLLGETKAELGGSEYQKLTLGKIAGRPPQLDLQRERDVQSFTLAMIRQGWVQSAHDLAEGGLAVALAESCIGSGFGAVVDFATELRADLALFSESQSRILLSIAPAYFSQLCEHAKEKGVIYQEIGKVGAENAQVSLSVNGVEIISQPLSALEAAWKDAIPCMMT